MSGTPQLSAEQIRADVAGLLGCDPGDLAPEANLLDWGLDSVRLMSLVERWREGGATDLDFVDLAERPELGHWMTLVPQANGGSS